MQETINEQQSTNTIKVDFQDKKLLIIIVILVCVVGLLCGIAFALLMNQRNNTNGISTQVSVSRYTISPVVTSTTTTLSTVTTQSTTTENTIQSVTTVDTTTSNTVSNDIKYLTYSDSIVSFQYPDGWKVVKNMDEVSFTITNGTQQIKLSRVFPMDCSGETYFTADNLRKLYVSTGLNIPGESTNKTYDTFSDIKYFNIHLKEYNLETALVYPPNIGDIPGMFLMQKGLNSLHPDRYVTSCAGVLLKASQYYFKANPYFAYDISLSIQNLNYENDTQAKSLANVIETFTNSFTFNQTQNVNGFNYTHNEGRFIRFDYPEGADITIKKFSLCNQGGGYCLIDGSINNVNDIGSIEITKQYNGYSQSITLFLGKYGDGGGGYTKYLGNQTFEINNVGIIDQFTADRSKLFMELYNPRFNVKLVASMDYNSNYIFSNDYPVRVFSLANGNGLNGYYLDFPLGYSYIKDNIDSGKLTTPGFKTINLECGLKDITDRTEANIRLTKCFLMADTFMNSFEIK